VAAKYCGSGRDLYLRRVLGARAMANTAMREGAVLHRVLAELIVGAKRAIYTHGPDGCLPHLAALPVAEEEGWAANGLRERVALLASFERLRIVGRVQEVLARQPAVGADALATLALPVTVERQLDGAYLGLAGHLAADAIGMFQGIVFDVKFGGRREFHRLTTAGYALVMESLYGQAMDIGCLVYVRFAGERVLVERDLHVIDDELRQWFIEERDERSRLVSEEIDPGRAAECALACPYEERCPVR
jgi:CRISPR-associated protein Csa1